MMLIIIIIMIIQVVESSILLELIKPEILLTKKFKVNMHMNDTTTIYSGDNYTYFTRGTTYSEDHGFKFQTKECGSLILNTPMVEGINYTIQFQIDNIQNGYAACFGVTSQGFIAQDLLGMSDYNSDCNTLYLKGYCSNKRRAHLFKDLFTNYDQFEEKNAEFLKDGGLFESFTVNNENIFKSPKNTLTMNLQGEQLIFMDDYSNTVIAAFEYIDRQRIYLPMIQIRNIEQWQDFEKKGIRNFMRQNRPKDKKDKEIDIPDIECIISGNNYTQVEQEELINKVEEKELSFLQMNYQVQKVSPKNPPPKVQVDEQEEQQVKSEFSAIFQMIKFESNIIEEKEFYNYKLITMRNSQTFLNGDDYIISQRNNLLPLPLQKFECNNQNIFFNLACSYSYLATQPLSIYSSALVQVSIIQLDFTNGVYPLGVGVFATEMLDHLRGWRNAQTQIWCLSEDLLQYGVLYRSDGTLFDSPQAGEVNIYSKGYATNRQGTVTLYISHGNRVAIRLGLDKRIQVLCINSKFKYFTPIFETKGWKGKPIIRLDKFEDHIHLPFEFSDSDHKLFEHFGLESNQFDHLNKYYIEKRGDFNDSDDDYTLSTQTHASMFMWATELYREQYQWYVLVNQVEQTQNRQICIGIHQLSQESLLENILKYKPVNAQVAYICNNNDFIHTFYEECPIYENTITLVSGSMLRFRLSDFLMEVTDGYRTIYFSLRKLGNTAVVPSVVIGGSNNIVTFLRNKGKQGPDITKTLQDIKLNFKPQVNYDIMSLPKFAEADQKKKEICSICNRSQIETSSSVTEVQLTHQILQSKPEVKNSNIPLKYDPRPVEILINKGKKIKKQQQFILDIDKLQLEPCIIIYDQCNFNGNQVVICGDHSKQDQIKQAYSFKLNRDNIAVNLVKQEGDMLESFIIKHNIECLSSYVDITNTSFYFII